MGSAQFKSTESDGILVLEDVLECLLEIDPNLNFAHAGNLLLCRMGFSILSALRSDLSVLHSISSILQFHIVATRP